MEARIVLEYKDQKTASTIANAISPDNFSTPLNLIIITSIHNSQVITEMKTAKKLTTLIATIDDFLFCVSTAEKTLKVMESKNPKEFD